MTDDSATVRDWTDVLARVRFGTVKVAGKNITGATIKAVAARCAAYADADGTRVRPGLARLAVDLELHFGSVKRAVQHLARLGLLRLVRPGARPGHADEYRLALPVDLLDRIDVWTPARHRLEVERIRDANRGRYPGRRDPTPGQGDLLVPEGPAEEADLLVPEGPAALKPAGPSGTDIGAPAGPCGTDLLVPQGPATHHGPRHNPDQPNHHRVSTAASASARDDFPQDPSPVAEQAEQTPTHCPDHPGLAAGRRPDGKPACPLCRRGAPPTPAPHDRTDDDPEADEIRAQVRRAHLALLQPRSA
ncbi:hypothetical protein [Phytohabitans aurantiacus]|uniref:Helix-turn-helix domain-containing protein n=1 Tax=Phytohabitans aurantiacus TaxID=3016789 RepID=A0ABQ5QRX4_9ACTN|nr:hypothetical protein [Phytohabitans aurantiacus]GLH97373.1 hypothetical protein Pa4123_26480 [Phytohabitans aurantiacus]